MAGLDSGQVIRWRSWHRWSALCLLACIYLAVTVALDRDTRAGLEIGLIPVTIPEMLRMLRGTVIPPPRRDHAHRQHWSQWRRRHQYASQASPPALECLCRCHTMITRLSYISGLAELAGIVRARRNPPAIWRVYGSGG